MKKRGQGYHLNWVFVAFAGVIILLFFIFFAVRYQDMKASQNNADIASSLDEMVYGLSTTTQYNSIEAPWKIKLTRDGCDGFFVNEDIRKSFDDKIMFWPDEFEGKELIVWTKEFKEPFFVANLIYFVDPNKDYYLIGGNELSEILPNVFDDNIHSFANYNSLDGTEEGVFVFLENLPLNYNNLLDKGNVILITEDRIRFVNTNDEVKNLGLAMELGAIFSETFSNYNCAVTRLMERYNIIKRIYFEKTLLLDAESTCEYGLIRGNLRNNVDEENLASFSESLYQANYQLWSVGCEVVF